MLHVMFTQILPTIPPAALCICVLSIFLTFLSPGELLGLKLLQTAPTQRSGTGACLQVSSAAIKRTGEGPKKDVAVALSLYLTLIGVEGCRAGLGAVGWC